MFNIGPNFPQCSLVKKDVRQTPFKHIDPRLLQGLPSVRQTLTPSALVALKGSFVSLIIALGPRFVINKKGCDIPLTVAWVNEPLQARSEIEKRIIKSSLPHGRNQTNTNGTNMQCCLLVLL